MSSSENRRVYIGNLAWKVRWQDLKDHMKQAGEVKYAEIIESDGRSKGCGIVEYADAESAERAIQTLNDSVLFDRKMFVREDREGRKHPFRPSGGGQASTRLPFVNDRTAGRQLYVGNLSWGVNWTDLKNLFGGQELVERADVAETRDGQSRGFGCVIMKTPELAESKVREFDGYEYEGRKLIVKLDQGPPPSPNQFNGNPNAMRDDQQ